MPPKEFVMENGKLKGVIFGKVKAEYDDTGKRKLVPTGEPDEFIEADEVIIAIGQDNSFPWIERDLGIEFGKWDLPVLSDITFQSTLAKVFFGGDAAFGPKNIITAVAQGHQAAISMDLFCSGRDLFNRPSPYVNLASMKMGIHEWMYDSGVVEDVRYAVPHASNEVALEDRLFEVELGFDEASGFKEAQRCLNCDVQTVFKSGLCIECDACVDVCPTDCITFIHNESEGTLRTQLSAPATDMSQDLYISDPVATTRIMVKDENVCLHCGLCSERCPTAAWDMQQFTYNITKASEVCQTKVL